MPVRIELITEIVIWLIIGVVAVTVGFILATIQRRVNRRRYFEELDRARQQASQVVERFYQKKGNLEGALAAFSVFKTKAERQALEEELVRHNKNPEELAQTREVLERLGWIREWIDTLRSRAEKPTGQAARILTEAGDAYQPPSGFRLRPSFAARSIAANKLARVPTPEGLCALVAGTFDPHPDVQEICVRHLGNFGDPAVLPLLLEELEKVLDGKSRVSVRNIKTALVQFPLEDADSFIPVLEGSNRRARFFAVDILREIADRRTAVQGLLSKNDFSPALYRLFTERLAQDDWGDVRARAASVIAHFHDPTSYKILENLSQDKEWFVRLHTSRAVASKFFLPVAPALGQRLTDSNWLVREAAVRGLMSMGDQGSELIIRSFLTGSDRFATEQVSEELQRSGLLTTLLDTTGESDQNGDTLLVIRKMVSLGKPAMLLAYLKSPVPSSRKLLLIQELSSCQTPDCLQAMQVVAKDDPDPEVRKAAMAVVETAMEQERSRKPIIRGK